MKKKCGSLFWDEKQETYEYTKEFKLFLRFLKDNNAYSSFIYEYFKTKEHTSMLFKINIDCESLFFLSYAFNWSKSRTKKRVFWVKLNKSWMLDYCHLPLDYYNKFCYE